MQAKNILVYGTSEWHPALRFIGERLAEEFRVLGYNVVYCDCSVDGSFESSMQLLNSGAVDFSVGLDALGIEWEREGHVIYPYQQMEIPHVSVMLDMPYNKLAKGHTARCKKHIVTIIDKTASGYIKALYPDKSENVLFLPLAGAPNDLELDIFCIDKNMMWYISQVYGLMGEITKL